MSEPRISSAERCRRALASAGYTRRQVTVRDSRYGSPQVTIRDPSVRLADVRACLDAAIPMRQIDADGDVFSCKGYEAAYLDALIAPIADEIERRLRAAGTRIVEVCPGVRLSHDGHGDIARWPSGEDFGRRYCYGVRHAAERIAAEDVLGRGIGLDVEAERPDPEEWIARLSLDDDPPAPRLTVVR